jgi:hypothetical protein
MNFISDNFIINPNRYILRKRNICEEALWNGYVMHVVGDINHNQIIVSVDHYNLE